MGLDNMPMTYPCAKEGTAVMDGDRISCKLTIEANGCPWKREREKLLGGVESLGIFGTPCWFRGKSGTWMLDALKKMGAVDAPNGGTSAWYGHGQEDSELRGLSPDECRDLAAYMADHAERYAQYVSRQDGWDPEEAIESYRYAVWWLEFAAEFGDGSDVWY